MSLNGRLKLSLQVAIVLQLASCFVLLETNIIVFNNRNDFTLCGIHDYYLNTVW